MKKILALILAFASLILCLCGCQVSDSYNDEDANNHQTSLPEEMPENFSFIVRWHTSGLSSYDSSSGELKKIRCDESAVYIMPQEELKTVYKLIYDLDILSYEDELEPSSYGFSNPNVDFNLTVSANGIVKTVSAPNSSGYGAGKTSKAMQYFATVKKIVKILEETDAWGSLIPRDSGPIK